MREKFSKSLLTNSNQNRHKYIGGDKRLLVEHMNKGLDIQGLTAIITQNISPDDCSEM